MVKYVTELSGTVASLSNKRHAERGQVTASIKKESGRPAARPAARVTTEAREGQNWLKKGSKVGQKRFKSHLDLHQIA